MKIYLSCCQLAFWIPRSRQYHIASRFIVICDHFELSWPIMTREYTFMLLLENSIKRANVRVPVMPETFKRPRENITRENSYGMEVEEPIRNGTQRDALGASSREWWTVCSYVNVVVVVVTARWKSCPARMIDVAGAAASLRPDKPPLHFIAGFEFLRFIGLRAPSRYKFLAVDSGAFFDWLGSVREKCRWECRRRGRLQDINNRLLTEKSASSRAKPSVECQHGTRNKDEGSL